MNWKSLLLLLVVASLTTTSCNKDDDSGGDAPTITAIQAVGTSFEDGASVTSDLNGATAAADVALNAVITVTLSKAVDATTVTATSVALSSAAGAAVSTVTATGSDITITPSAELERGTLYTLTLTNVASTDGGVLVTTTRSFTTEGRAPVVVPNAADMIAYWSFDGITDDATGNYNPDNEVGIAFGEDRFGQGSSSAVFDGDVSIIEVPGADAMMTHDDFTLAFWMKTNSAGHVNENGDPASHFVMGLGAFFGFQFEVAADYAWCKLAASYKAADGTTHSEDLWFNGSGEDAMNGGWQGWDYVADLTGSGGVASLIKDKWVHVVCTYDATTKRGTMYLNGELMKSQDFNLWPDGDVKQTITGVTYRGVATDVEPILALGFIKSIDSPMWAAEPWGGYSFPTANHFKGELDDVRVFSAPFSAADAAALYNAEKP
jgi:Bacterial Ig-like domain/Concanavalin A-like lectin/glucanases superfamily